MRPTTKLGGLLAFALAVCWSSPALPCGGAFGQGMTIGKDQTIVVALDAGIETYIFQPRFCGQVADFGLILPVPASLSSQPALANAALYTELETVTAPRRETRKICRGSKSTGGGPTDAGAGNWSDAGVAVVEQGHVGIFDWSLLKAESAESFTAWLDANSYPHATEADAQFAHYVNQGWYFVAFKVTAASSAPSTGQTICGDFGPIQLSFPATTPVVPTRIAAVSSGASANTWRVYTVAGDQMTAAGAEYYGTTRFSGVLDADTLAKYHALATLVAAGKRLTKLDINFYPKNLAGADLMLQATAAADYRDVVYDYVYEDCSVGCSVSGGPSCGGPLLIWCFILLALGALARWRRAR